MQERTRNLRHALALSVALCAVACGGDDGPTRAASPDAGSGRDAGDAGHGDIDGGPGPGIDASHIDAAAEAGVLLDASVDGGGTTGDAAVDALAAALDLSGVHASSARAMQIFQAYCPRSAACTPGSGPDDEQACEDQSATAYGALVDSSASDACLDATLDLYACAVPLSCDDFFTGCTNLTDAYSAACPPPPDTP